MSDDVRVPCGRRYEFPKECAYEREGFVGICVNQNHLCPNCTELLTLRRRVASALASVDGVDLREGHIRDNSTPDGLRDKLLGAGLTIGALRRRVAELEATAARRLELLRELRDSFCAAAKLPCREPNVKIIREMGHYLRLLDRVDAEISAAAEVAAGEK
jgi:sugar phosphate isomerase/epimerase